MNHSTIDTAAKVRDLLAKQNARIVLVESCTAGRIAATLGVLPGVSKYLCGSFVVYRNDSKARWLGITPHLLDSPGPVSAEVTEQLALSALRETPEARYALAITGDVGPGAPASTDGVCFGAFVDRSSDRLATATFRLTSPAPRSDEDVSLRLNRLEEATDQLLAFAANQLATQTYEQPE